MTASILGGTLAEASLKISGGVGHDTITASGDSSADFGPYAGGGRTENIISGDDGDDQIVSSASAGGGSGGFARHVIAGGSGNDTITASAQGSGAGGGRAETDLSGDDGNDHLTATGETSGESGTVENTLRGSSGDDVLNGTANASAPFGASASNTADGGDGHDRITLTATANGGESSRASNQANGGAGNDIIAGTADAASFEVVARNLLYGDAGNDHIVAVGGSDGYGDFLASTGGNPWSVANILSGGTGNDTLTGSNHRDIFVYATGDGSDVITSLQDGHDKIGLTGGLTFAQLTISASGASDTLIEVKATGEDLAIVQGVAPTLFSAADFLLM